jgi:hypothetical protein
MQDMFGGRYVAGAGLQAAETAAHVLAWILRGHAAMAYTPDVYTWPPPPVEVTPGRIPQCDAHGAAMSVPAG